MSEENETYESLGDALDETLDEVHIPFYTQDGVDPADSTNYYAYGGTAKVEKDRIILTPHGENKFWERKLDAIFIEPVLNNPTEETTEEKEAN